MSNITVARLVLPVNSWVYDENLIKNIDIMILIDILIFDKIIEIYRYLFIDIYQYLSTFIIIIDICRYFINISIYVATYGIMNQYVDIYRYFDYLLF